MVVVDKDFWCPSWSGVGGTWHPLIPDPAPWDAGREERDRDSAPHEPVSFLHRQAWASDVLFAVELWGPSGSSWKSKGKNNISGWPRRGAVSWLDGTISAEV